jgi:plastocyanin
VAKDAPLARASGGGGQATSTKDAVAVESFAYSPQRIEVAAGQKVTWTNRDPAPHTVTAEDGTFDSGTMEPGGTFSAVFDDPGEYRYICSLHPGMEGVVVVHSAS